MQDEIRAALNVYPLGLVLLLRRPVPNEDGIAEFRSAEYEPD